MSQVYAKEISAQINAIVKEAGCEIDKIFPEVLSKNHKAGAEFATLEVDLDIPVEASLMLSKLQARATLSFIKPRTVKTSVTTQCEGPGLDPYHHGQVYSKPARRRALETQNFSPSRLKQEIDELLEQTNKAIQENQLMLEEGPNDGERLASLQKLYSQQKL